MSDSSCNKIGIPERLHHEGREIVAFDKPGETLFRRFNLENQGDITACISFKNMSVNRGLLSELKDALLNTQTGETYLGHGVIQFCVRDVELVSIKLEMNNSVYGLRPVHAPNKCNYSHSEVIATKDSHLTPEINSATVKLEMRKAFKRFVKVALPIDRAGEELPVKLAKD